MLVPCSSHPTWLLFSFSSGEQSPNLKLLMIGIISSETPWEEQTESGFLPLPVGYWKGRCRDGAGYLRTSLRSKLQEAFLVLLTPLALRLSISVVPLKTPPLDRPHQFRPRILFMHIQILRPHHRTRDHRSWPGT